MTATVLERITQPDAVGLLANQGVDVSALSVKREALQRKLDNLTDAWDADDIDDEQYRKGSRMTRTKLAEIDRQLADATRVSPATALVAAGGSAWQLWTDMTPTQRANAVNEVATVTIHPCPRGQSWV